MTKHRKSRTAEQTATLHKEHSSTSDSRLLDFNGTVTVMPRWTGCISQVGGTINLPLRVISKSAQKRYSRTTSIERKWHLFNSMLKYQS